MEILNVPTRDPLKNQSDLSYCETPSGDVEVRTDSYVLQHIAKEDRPRIAHYLLTGKASE